MATPRIASIAIALLASMAGSTELLAQQAFFMGLGDLPGGGFYSTAVDVSADGTVVIGSSEVAPVGPDAGGGQGFDAFRWTRETGMVGLGLVGRTSANGARKISDDGSTIVGLRYRYSGDTGSYPPDLPYRWTEATGMTSFPTTAGAPTGVSADGSVITLIDNWWSQSTGIQDPPAGLDVMWDVSGDGEKIVGHESGGPALLWDRSGGLTELEPSELYGSARAISANGQAMVGYVHEDGVPRASLWTSESGHRFIDAPLPGGARPVAAGSHWGISGDGSIVVGRASGGPDRGALIWDAIHGGRNLKQVLSDEYALTDSLNGWSLFGANSISADGRTIVGQGTNPNGHTEAWIAFLGTATGPDFTGDGVVDGADLLAWQRGFGLNSGASRARGDANADGQVDAADLAVWQSQYGGGTAATTAASVPEPGAALLAALALAPLMRSGRRARRRSCGNTSPGRTASIGLVLLTVLAQVNVARAQQSFFMGLGDLPGGSVNSIPRHISADGSAVVGSSSATNGTEAFRWTRDTGIVGLGVLGSGTRVSDDGSKVIGVVATSNQSFSWTAETGMTLLPDELEGAKGSNADGSIIVGPFNWWSATTGIHPPVAPMERLNAVSGDGNVFTGYIPGGSGYAWSQATGIVNLSPNEDVIFSDPLSVSADGSVIAGYGYVPGGGGVRAVRWTAQTGPVFLDQTPGGAIPLGARGMSADGLVIVGSAGMGGTDSGAFIWDPLHGSRNLKQVLIDDYGLGGSVDGWDLRIAQAVSGDGRTIVGYDTPSNRGWIAFLGTPTGGDFTGDGAVDGADLLAWQRGFGLNSGASRAQGDANADGQVDAADLAVWKSQYRAPTGGILATAVPEPHSAILASLSLLALSVVRAWRW